MNSINVKASTPGVVPQRQIDAAFRNDQAAAIALGDPRGAIKRHNLMRPGVSLSRAQRAEAGNRGAMEMSNAMADAYEASMQQGVANANASLQAQRAQEQYAQALASLQQQRFYNAQREAIARQGNVLGMFGNLLGGLMK